jgi:VWFA-related protein
MRSLLRFVFMAILCLALPTPPMAAQRPQPEEPSIFGEVIDVRVVNVEVVVTDRDGNRVRDLKPSDFRLKVDGKAVPIDFFTEVAGGQAAPSVAVAEPEASAQAPSATPPASVAPGGPVPTSYLVFVDDFFATKIRRNEVLRALKDDLGRLGPEDKMAIVAYDGGRLTMVSNWSGSTNQLARAFDEAMTRPARGLDRVTELRMFDSDEGFASQAVGDDAALDLSAAAPGGLNLRERAYGATLSRQVEGAVGAVVSTLRAFAAPPGRKVMLLLTGGWPFSIESFVRNGNPTLTPEFPTGEKVLRELTNTANLLGYTIYPVDVPGAEASAADSTSFAAGAGNSLREQEVEGSLEFVAKETGGQALRNSNRTAAFRQAGEDTRSYYWLGFTPTWERNDKRHRVEVEMTRPGLRVRTRNSFLDLSKKAEVTMMVESAMLFGNLPGSIPMPVQLGTPKPGKRGMVEIPVTLGLPVDILTVVPVNGKYRAEAELRIAATDKDGNGSDVPVTPLKLASDKPPKAGGFVRYDTKITLRGKATHLVLAVYDPLSGKIAIGEADLKLP